VALHEAGDSKRIEPAAMRVWRLPESARTDLGAHLQAALAEQARRRLGGASP
jgi:hypothetical protein